MRTIFGALLCILLLACTDSKQEKLLSYLKQWENKEILIPEALKFYVFERDSVCYQNQSKWKIISYVDSTGCVGCKLRFEEWKNFLHKIEGNVSAYFFLSPKDKSELDFLIRRSRFDYPISTEGAELFFQKNKLSDNPIFHSFLLDENNRVVAIGNPILNPNVGKLYEEFILGSKKLSVGNCRNITENTEVDVDRRSVSLGVFDKEHPQKVAFILKNVGKYSLTIDDVLTSCQCTTASFNQEPIQPGDMTTIEVVYKAEKAETFYRTISVYCNVNQSPLELEIFGKSQ